MNNLIKEYLDKGMVLVSQERFWRAMYNNVRWINKKYGNHLIYVVDSDFTGEEEVGAIVQEDEFKEPVYMISKPMLESFDDYEIDTPVEFKEHLKDSNIGCVSPNTYWELEYVPVMVQRSIHS